MLVTWTDQAHSIPLQSWVCWPGDHIKNDSSTTPSSSIPDALSQIPCIGVVFQKMHEEEWTQRSRTDCANLQSVAQSKTTLELMTKIKTWHTVSTAKALTNAAPLSQRVSAMILNVLMKAAFFFSLLGLLLNLQGSAWAPIQQKSEAMAMGRNCGSDNSRWVFFSSLICCFVSFFTLTSLWRRDVSQHSMYTRDNKFCCAHAVCLSRGTHAQASFHCQ